MFELNRNGAMALPRNWLSVEEAWQGVCDCSGEETEAGNKETLQNGLSTALSCAKVSR